MTVPLIIEPDPEKVIVDYLKAVIPVIPEMAGWSVGTIRPATPKNFVQVRHIGEGDKLQGVTFWPLLDLRVWADGTELTTFTRGKVARILAARLTRDLIARTVGGPVALPDPVDGTKVHTLLSFTFPMRGVQT